MFQLFESLQAALAAAQKRAADAADADKRAADAALEQLGKDKDAVIAAERADASKPPLSVASRVR